MTISSDAQITDLAVDDHACLTFGDPEELLDLTAAYVRDGLSCGLKVVLLRDSAPRLTVTAYIVAGSSGRSGTKASTRPCCSNRPPTLGSMVT